MQLQAQNQSSPTGSSVSVKATKEGFLFVVDPSVPFHSKTLTGAGLSNVEVPTGYTVLKFLVRSPTLTTAQARITSNGTAVTVTVPTNELIPCYGATKIEAAGAVNVSVFGVKN